MNEFQKARSIFEECLGTERKNWPAIIEQSCAGNAVLKTKVEKLLQGFGFPNANLSKIVRSEIDRLEILVLTENRVIGDFRIIKQIGKGAFAEVYLAEHLPLQRLVALKISDKKTDESLSLAKINHSHIVQIYSQHSMEIDGFVKDVVCMQYVAGQNLREFFLQIKSPDAPVRMILEFMLRIAEALAAAHRKEIIHFDVKPENILVDERNNFLLTDFNIALDKKRFNLENLGGSERYMAPEQRQLFTALKQDLPELAYKLDDKVDVFSLGQVAKDFAQVLKVKHLSIKVIIEKAVKNKPSERFGSAQDFADACRFHLSLLDLEKKLEPSTRVAAAHQLARSFPLLSATVGILLPNIVASFFQIQYNKIHILPTLSTEQINAFEHTVLPWNSFIYLLAGSLIAWFFNPIIARKSLSALQGVLIKLTSITIAGWCSGCALFLSVLNSTAPGLSPSAIGHFLISFAIGLAIPLTVTRLLVSYLIFVVFYPQILCEKPEVEKICKKGWPNLRGLKYAPGLVCFFGAFVVLFSGPGYSGYQNSYQVLVGLFSAIGILLMILGVEISERIIVAVKFISRLR